MIAEKVSHKIEVKTILDLLKVIGLQAKYEQVVQREKLTLENFVKLVEMDQSGLTSTFLKRCKMSCGDFAELVMAYERNCLSGKPLVKSNQIKDEIVKARLKYN